MLDQCGPVHSTHEWQQQLYMRHRMQQQYYCHVTQLCRLAHVFNHTTLAVAPQPVCGHTACVANSMRFTTSDVGFGRRLFYQILQVIGSNTLCHNSCHIAAQMNFVCMAHNLQDEAVRQFYLTGGYPNKCTERMHVLYQENGCTAVKVHTH